MCIFGGIDVHARRLWLSHHLDLDSLNRLAAKLGFPLSATSMIPHDSRQLLLTPQRHIGLAAKLAYHFYLLQLSFLQLAGKAHYRDRSLAT